MAGRSAALAQRVGTNLNVPPGSQKVEDIEAELAGAQTTLAAATDRHRQTKSTLSDMLQQIEGVPPEEVAIGMAVEAVWEDKGSDEGEPVRLPQWRRRAIV